MLLGAHEQLMFDALVSFSKNMDTLRQLAVMVREVQKHKLELQQKVVDEVDALVEIVPMPTDPPVKTWSEEKLVLGRQRARSTGKLIRHFGQTIVGIELLSHGQRLCSKKEEQSL